MPLLHDGSLFTTLFANSFLGGEYEPVSGEPPFKRANAMDLSYTLGKRDEDYCNTLCACHQFSICVYVTVPETELHVVL